MLQESRAEFQWSQKESKSLRIISPDILVTRLFVSVHVAILSHIPINETIERSVPNKIMDICLIYMVIN